ncbi:hypothetical protein BWQ96_04494 [Gracilariopsis chorda]|uniref:Uncharacterized protein n=1 Tax=Gracilariopsis chorda TaxID=448386 RepID=A0A2V3IUA7_9FLOR|nr:hypothetical protein BWQ96_04494 [Gracilariopsis chorda]|eukprot:PXF45726.1 hypothetical protein BWQ96_04494 [Gracilariopsis chorda]
MKAISRDAVEFGLREPLSNTSRRMILENAQMKENDIKVKRNSASLSTLLKVCGGLPVALAVAGQLVREHGSEFDDPFGEVLTRIECHEGEVQMYNVPGYGALSGLLDAAIQFCQRRHSHEWTQRTGVSFENLVLSLCVLKRQQFAPVGMLRRLWGLENDSSTRELVKIMKNAGLVKEEIMQGKYKQVPGIRLHDLIHAHFHTKAGGRREKYHKQFLSRYIEHDPQQAYRAWWQVDGQEDNYIYLNIFTHLLMAGLNNEAALLSLDPRWTVKQFRVNGEVQVFYDHSWLKTNLVKVKSIPTSDLAGIPEALELISDAITLAAPYVVRNEREIWFQLYGRLLQRESIVLDGYLEKIRRHAERSWLRAAGKCMTQAGGLITGLWAMDRAKFLVLDVWVGQDDWVLVFGKIKHAESEVYEMWRLEKRSQSKQKRIWFVTIRGKAMQSFASDNGRKLGLVVGDGRLQLWDTENDKQLGCEQNSCEQNSCEQDAQDATEFGKFSANGTM